MADDLYPNALLALAADIAHLGALAEADARARKRSMVCGSEVAVSLTTDADGRISALGVEVEACALGQASAAVFARHAIGASLADVRAARTALEALLKTGTVVDAARFPELVELAPVHAYPRRHASTLLVWRAAEEALATALDEAAEAASAPTSMGSGATTITQTATG